MKSFARVFSLVVAVLFVFSSFISYASVPQYEGQILDGEALWDSYYSDDTLFYSFCDTDYMPSEMDSDFSSFYIYKDDFASWPNNLDDFFYLSDVMDFTFQKDTNDNYLIAVRGWNEEKKNYCSMLLNLTTREIIHCKTANSLPSFYGNKDTRTSLSATEVSNIIVRTYGYDQMEYCEGGIYICFLPEYGFVYSVGGGCYQEQNKHQDSYGDYYDFDRVDVLMDPFSGKILASSRMPYTAY